MIISFLAITIQVIFDQYTKYLAIQYLKGNSGIVLIDGVLQLLYIENRGAAFGILQNSIVLFCIITAIILIAIIYVYIRMPVIKKYAPLFVLLSFLTAGAVGNLIDRIMNGFVVDFIYFSLIDFPVFNVADIYVTVSVTLIIILSLFLYSDDEFAFLKLNRTKLKDNTYLADVDSNELEQSDNPDEHVEESITNENVNGD